MLSVDHGRRASSQNEVMPKSEIDGHSVPA
jgi:hypothetical protein